MRARDRHTRKRRGGFTLIEVMAAVSIIVLVFFSCFQALIIGFRIIEDARFSTLASQVLQSEMENLRLKNWVQLGALPASGTFDIESSMVTATFGKFTCSRTIADAGTDLKQVTLVLTWDSTDGHPHSRRYTTYIAKDGLNDYYYRTF
jgi:prepilin-type N-terminal cleavage/methylation domain-containing protein